MSELFTHTKNRLTALHFPKWSVPLLLVVVCLLAYGLLTPGQGFYWDEWNLIYKAVLQHPSGLWNYLNLDGHPQVTWFFTLAFKLLGLRPLNWQLFSLFWRVLSVVGFWLVIDRVWPARPLETALAALFFALYPAFYVQAESMVYVDVWFGLTVLWASFYFSLRAMQAEGRWRWVFLGLSLLFKGLHCFTTDYTWGTELMRPLLLWLALPAAARAAFWSRLKTVTLAALPFLFITAGMYYWRLFIFQIPEKINEGHGKIHIFEHFARRPWDTTLGLITTYLGDAFTMLVSIWGRVFSPALFGLDGRASLPALGLMLLAAAAAGLYLWRLRAPQPAPGRWANSALLAGLAGLIFGMLPFYAAGYVYSVGFQANDPDAGRFILGALAGLALLAAAVLDLFLSSFRRRRVLFVALLVGVTAGWQMQSMNQYRQIAHVQQQFYSELAWRAPDIRPNTGFVVQDGMLPINHAMSFAINLLYERHPNPSTRLPYGVVEFAPADLQAQAASLAAGAPLNFHRYTDFFAGNSRRALYLTFAPQAGQCLWVVNPDQANDHSIAGTYRPLAAVNDFHRIKPYDNLNMGFFNAVFGGQPAAQPWCYYFEKADLARQYRDWTQVTALWRQASAQNLAAGDGIEYMPFIEAFARQGDWQTAYTLTKTALRTSPDAVRAYQIFWARLARSTPPSADKTDIQNMLPGLFEPSY